MNRYSLLLNSIVHYVEQLFFNYKFDDLRYHGFNHTQNVVKHTYEIVKNYCLDSTEIFIIAAAAWFHDTGHLFGGPALHEDRSVIIMKGFFDGKQLNSSIIEKIESCICATKFPHKPKSLLEEILCDADTFNLGTEDFLQTDELLKEEFKVRGFTITDWEENTLDFLLRHHYFTEYCQVLLAEGKKENIQLMKYLLQEK